MVELGKAIRIVREAKGLRLNRLAEAAGVSTPFLSLIESGGRQASLRVLRSIAKALDVPSEVLILLCVGSDSTLRTTDQASVRLQESIRKLADAEDDLRRTLYTKGGTGETEGSVAK